MGDKKLCFVVMGFGKKTDFESGRTLDLDATYDAIIRPAVENSGLRCIRADEVAHSGVIDLEMYEMLLRSDLVIADISTGNPNAIYELGVRHALCPNSTIIMKEDAGRLYFDLDHINTFQYKHLGEDIGAREAVRASSDLARLIQAALTSEKPDSPVYTFMPRLQRPMLSDKQFAEMVDEVEAEQERLAFIMRQAEEFSRASQHENAILAYRTADTLKPHDPFIVQQLALATYKAKKPDAVSALVAGLQIISALNPDQSNDPETRGITGAIHKRLWLATHEIHHLDLAIRNYRRGFEVRGDYYNGENLATCFEFRADTQKDAKECLFDLMSAEKIRLEIIENLKILLASEDFNERNDIKWIYATLANCYRALGNVHDAEIWEAKFHSSNPAAWEVETYRAGREQASASFVARQQDK